MREAMPTTWHELADAWTGHAVADHDLAQRARASAGHAWRHAARGAAIGAAVVTLGALVAGAFAAGVAAALMGLPVVGLCLCAASCTRLAVEASRAARQAEEEARACRAWARVRGEP